MQNECCEELGTRLNLSTLKLDLYFREIVSHADDLKYVRVKVKGLEKHIQEHEWRSRHFTIHHGYSVVLYVTVCLFCLYIAYRVIRCMVTKGLCREITGALRYIHQTRADPEFTGSGNIVNINIKISNESLTGAQDVIPLRTQSSPNCVTGESEAQSTQRLRQSRTHF